jgi:hypothetical protein
MSRKTLMNKTWKSQAGKAKVDQWDYEKGTSLCTAKKQSRLRDNLQNGKKLSVLNDPSDKDLYQELIRH